MYHCLSSPARLLWIFFPTTCILLLAQYQSYNRHWKTIFWMNEYIIHLPHKCVLVRTELTTQMESRHSKIPCDETAQQHISNTSVITNLKFIFSQLSVPGISRSLISWTTKCHIWYCFLLPSPAAIMYWILLFLGTAIPTSSNYVR